MQKRILMLATSAFILACGATTASAQQGPMMQQQAQPQQQQERTPQGAQMPRRGAGDDFDDDSEITGWHHGLGSRRDRDWGRGDMGFDMMRGGGMMGADGMHSGSKVLSGASFVVCSNFLSSARHYSASPRGSTFLILSPSQTAASVDIFMIALVPQTAQRHRSANGLAALGPQSQWVLGCFVMAISFRV